MRLMVASLLAWAAAAPALADVDYNIQGTEALSFPGSPPQMTVGAAGTYDATTHTWSSNDPDLVLDSFGISGKTATADFSFWENSIQEPWCSTSSVTSCVGSYWGSIDLDLTKTGHNTWAVTGGSFVYVANYGEFGACGVPATQSQPWTVACSGSMTRTSVKTSAPELDASSLFAALTLLAGVVAALRGRRPNHPLH